MIDFNNLTIKEAHNALISGELTVSDLVAFSLKKIEAKNKEVNAFIEIYHDIDEQVKFADSIFADGKATIMTGIPVAIKDNILNKGKKVSSASKILENYQATYDATVVEKLKLAGAIIIGRTNMDEFAMGGSTENSIYGPTKNPYDLSRVAGGSSGGSAVALAINSVLFSLGSDTGGSVRQPASFCNLVGLKPTYGSVSRYGLMSLGSSFDQISPFAKNIEDAQTIYEFISDYDSKDSTSVPLEMRIKKEINKKMTIGLPIELLDKKGIDKEVWDNFQKIIAGLKEAGVGIKEIRLPNLANSLAAYYILMPAEASTNLARFDGVRFGLSLDGADFADVYKKTRGVGFGREVRRRIILGTYVLSHGYYDAFYNKACVLRQFIKKEFKDIFSGPEGIDAILTPTSPFPAFKLGEKINDPVQMYLADIFTVPTNIIGAPAMSIPSGMTEGKLPLGVQLMTDHWQEDILFILGKEIEKIVKNGEL